MSLPQLIVYRHDTGERALITLAGEIDLETALLVREALERCVHDGARTIDVDLTAVVFCDCSGLNVFIEASQRTGESGVSLQLHHPPYTLATMVEFTGTRFLLASPPSAPGASPPPAALTVTAPAPPPVAVPEAPRRLVTGLSAVSGTGGGAHA
ncbi:STAS domain-containing protein [Streptomyces sp. NPDC057298]|uniref:STAS domain-containing protein n=1 Tax=Streptomyces sp. NPDC057298 TaxID=3346091 RepID=UPI00363878AE